MPHVAPPHAPGAACEHPGAAASCTTPSQHAGSRCSQADDADSDCAGCEQEAALRAGDGALLDFVAYANPATLRRVPALAAVMADRGGRLEVSSSRCAPHDDVPQLLLQGEE